jgi:23S rRNA (cytosine1962-C5)-methyltransferase
MGDQVTLTAKGERWARSRHPWVYQDDLKERQPALSGQIVQVKAPNGRPMGQAFYNAKSKIALRWLTDNPDLSMDRDFWAGRLQKAIDYRKRKVSGSSAYRLIFSEADGFPGLIVDCYDEILVLQSLGLGIDQILPTLVELLTSLLHPKAIVARNDASVRKLEGLPVEKRMILGDQPNRVEVKEGEVCYLVDVWEGHKTGAYLDQRENRLWARGFAKGAILDAFAYQGGFTMHVASKADEVLAIEDSSSAIGLLQENLKLNKLTNVRVERANAFDRLKALEKEKALFDLVILDPPAFARNKNELPGACRGYREINLRAMRILKPGGILVSCSCSYQVSEEIFLAILREAAADSGRSVHLLETRTQAKDHPILITHPEGKYLKCVALEVIE